MSQLFYDKEKKGKILLIDGMYLIFSSYYAFGNMKSASGFPTGAVYGFITRIDFLLKELQPDYLIVALDAKGKTFRHELFPEYKAKRKDTPEDLLKQIPVIKEYLKLKQIDTVEWAGYEGDDIIYFYQKEADRNQNEVIIFTADKDMFQLVDENTSIFHPKLKKKLNREAIREYYGLYPEQVVDYLSLMGDASDNIPGAKGIGEKSAKKLLEEYESLENIFARIEDIVPKFRKKLEDSRDNIELSRKLVRLDTDIPQSFSLVMNPIDYPATSELARFYKTYSFNSLFNKIEDQLKEQTQINRIGYHIVRTRQELDILAEEIKKQGHFAFDVETTGLHVYSDQMVGFSIAFLDRGYYIPIRFPEIESPEITISLSDIQSLLAPIFGDPAIRKSGFNLKFDIQFMKTIGIETEGIADDGMLASGLLFPNRRSHKLKDLTFEQLNINQKTFENVVGSGKDEKAIESIPVQTVGEYCIDDANTSLKLSHHFEPLMKKRDVHQLYESLEIPLIPILSEMEYTGVKIDRSYLQQSIDQLEDKLATIEKEIIDQAGYVLNINSSKQLSELLFEKMKLPIAKKTRKTKSYSTDIEVLTEYKQIPIVANLIKYRGWKKLYSTYLVGIKERIDSDDRIHTSFNQAVTATGRLSSSNPNLQNIPVFQLDDINIRKLFISGQDKKLLAVDYSQIELRVMAHFSKDENLKNAFLNNRDIHSQTANLVFGRDLFMDDQLKRKRAKIINFSIIYGSGPYSLSKELEVSFKEAKAFIDTYFEKYPGVKSFIENTTVDAEKNGYVRTMERRKREIPELASSTPNIKDNGRRMAVNTIIQGSAAEIIKRAMIRIGQRIRQMNSKMILSVHDEIIFEYPLSEESKLIQIVSEEMKNAVKLDVPLEISIKTGFNWGEMESFRSIK